MITALLLAAVTGLAPVPTDTALHFAKFGTVAVYRPAAPPTRTALFFSGDGGWNQGVVDMARLLANAGTLVLGVDTPAYFKAVDAGSASCTYLAADLESLSQYAQKTLGLAHYQVPFLVGYSSGAGAAYATLAQAPENTFLGAVALGWDPTIPTRTALCDRNGLTTVPAAKGAGRRVRPVPHLPGKFIVLHGVLDQVWPVDSASAFTGQVPGAQFVQLAHVGHGFSETANWAPQFTHAVASMTDTIAPGPMPAEAVADLPLVELPMPAGPTKDWFALVLSGDGGWASIDKQIGQELVKAGVPTVGFNSLQYFWQKRTPEQSAADLARIIQHYQEAFHRSGVVLVGYSRGADVLPIMATRLSPALLDQVKLMAFLGIEHRADLEFRVTDWINSRRDAAYDLGAEVKKLAGRPMLCVWGTKEGDTLCPDLPAGLAQTVQLQGGHHFDGDFAGLARLVIDHVN